MILSQLVLVEEHIGQGEQGIRHQREIIDDLGRHGQDVAEAQAVLRNYERAQALHMQERHRFLRELAG